MADNGFKSGFANALQSMMEEKLPGCGIKACFGWDPDTKCVTADKYVWDEYIKEYRHQRRNLRRCTRDVRSKYKNKVSNWYDGFEATAKWKLANQKKEARKTQREAKNKGDASVSQKRKEPHQVDPNSAAPPKNKKQKEKEVKQGKKKVVLSESSNSDDKGWKPTLSANGSSDTDNDEEDNVTVDKTRARLFKKLKAAQRENVAPEAKADYNQTKLEDYDIRYQDWTQ
ncbi:hypothetical protein K1719_002272 [Acacia pycnantha]|nr:hypothetical protein K1719_002272 [Acacia pycnantha]